MADDNKALWINWMSEWRNTRARPHKPEREVRFWTEGVDDATQARLTDYLRAQESLPSHYAGVSAAVYALRQIGYIRRTITERDMLTWLSDNLTHDYVAPNNAHRFRNAWNEHGRYTPQVKSEINELAKIGIARRNNE